jgi:hypothetical protein
VGPRSRGWSREKSTLQIVTATPIGIRQDAIGGVELLHLRQAAGTRDIRMIQARQSPEGQADGSQIRILRDLKQGIIVRVTCHILGCSPLATLPVPKGKRPLPA